MADENQRKKQKTAGLGDGGSSSCVTSGDCIEGGGDSDFAPFSNLVTPMLTDMYQLTMCYGYWTAKRHEMTAVFDLYFRKAPFHGTFTIFGGLSQVLAFLNTYKITSKQIDYLKTLMPTANPKFFEWLATLDCSQVKVFAFKEGSVVFPREPLLRVEGPIGICQLLETTLLCLINYASLIATNAARMRLAAGGKTLLEMGLRRAQGPDGGVSASRYAYMGGFDATSNVAAGELFGIKVSGTQAHAFIQSFSSLDDLPTRRLRRPAAGGAERGGEGDDEGDYDSVDLVELVLKYRVELGAEDSNIGELTAFIAYCQAFPTSFLALVDTYDTLKSGVPNFLACALALIEIGYFPLGIRLDSGDLFALSTQTRAMFRDTEEKYESTLPAVLGLGAASIVASNDLDEEKLYELRDKGHEVNAFGIGTNLVTCRMQPALGCVYKLVEMNAAPRIKLSQELAKITVPTKKRIFRLFSEDDRAMTDIMISEEEVKTSGVPRARHPVTCRHPFDPARRSTYTAARVEEMLNCMWDGGLACKIEGVKECRERCLRELDTFCAEHFRRLNPVPYEVMLSEGLFETMHKLWLSEAPSRLENTFVLSRGPSAEADLPPRA